MWLGMPWWIIWLGMRLCRFRIGGIFAGDFPWRQMNFEMIWIKVWSSTTFGAPSVLYVFLQWTSCFYWLDSYTRTCSEDILGMIFSRIQWQRLFTYRYFLWKCPSFFSLEDSSETRSVSACSQRCYGGCCCCRCCCCCCCCCCRCRCRCRCCCCCCCCLSLDVVGILKVNKNKLPMFWKFPPGSDRCYFGLFRDISLKLCWKMPHVFVVAVECFFFAPSNTHRSSVWSPYNVEYWRWSKRWWAFNAALIQNLRSWA